MTMNTDTVDVDERIAVGQLLDSRLLVRQPVIAQVAIAEVMIPFRTARMSAPVPDRDHDKTGLCQTIRAHTHTAERINGSFDLGPRIYIIDDRIQSC